MMGSVQNSLEFSRHFQEKIGEFSTQKSCPQKNGWHRASAAMAVIQPEGQITWGGAVLPRIETLDPRIRKAGGSRI
jgi:hypothetical protein